MRTRRARVFAAGSFAGSILIAMAMVGGPRPGLAAPAGGAGAGTIRGHIGLLGKLPGNPVIRMGMDPKCAQLNAGKLTVQETVVASLDGSLANVFVELQGNFPPAPVPSAPVSIEQRGCVYRPRVLGMRAGQMLKVRNDDDVLHNIHSSSGRSNRFNVSQPQAGLVQQFRLKDEEIMVHITCDVHSWMNAFVGVVNHPYFAVSGTAGTFEIANVPEGTYKIYAWHERYGPLLQEVRVRAGAATAVNLSYTGAEKPSAGIPNLMLPFDSVAQLFSAESR